MFRLNTTKTRFLITSIQKIYFPLKPNPRMIDVVDIVVVANVVVVTLLVGTGHITFSCGVFLWWVGGWDG